jgi:regulator of replication initiation timing
MSVETAQSLTLKSEDLRKKLLQVLEEMASKKANIQKEIAEVYQVDDVVK